jgi:collagen triple helix repeat protein
MVVALVALFLALGGTGLAASRFIITSTSQIKPNVLRALRGTQGPPGAPGAPGSPGPPGAQGQGLQGLQGPQGGQGPQGAEGAVGPRGLTGEKGKEGPTGGEVSLEELCFGIELALAGGPPAGALHEALTTISHEGCK